MSSHSTTTRLRRRRRPGRHLGATTGAQRTERRPAERSAAPLDSPNVQTEPDPHPGGRSIDFARIFDAVPSPCLLLTPELVICGANRAYLQATGRTLDGLTGRYMFDAFPDNPDDPSADGVANLRASLERAFATRRPDTMAVQKYDIEVSHAGELRFEERYWSPVNVPVLDSEGRVVLLIHSVEDVTAFLGPRTGRPDRGSGGTPAVGRNAQGGPAEGSPAAHPDRRVQPPEGPTDRDIARALQNALRPHAVRSVGPLEVATRYLPARPALVVCGDWYDVADLGGSAMSVVVGDVVGHGLEAAAVMGQLRGAAAAALNTVRRPAAAMGVLERRARSVDGATGATAFIAVIDTAAGTLTYCNAGQVPPLLVRADRTMTELDGARSPVLCAVEEDVPHPEVTIPFGPGCMLIAFTDGLVERPGEDLIHGYGRLRRAVDTSPTDLDHCADAVLEAALHDHVRADDVAMVVIRSRHR